MKVIHFNSYAVGGSAVLMLRLYQELLKRSVDSQFRFRAGQVDTPNAVRSEFQRGSIDRVTERIGYSLENRMLRSDSDSYFSRTKTLHPTRLPESDRDAGLLELLISMFSPLQATLKRSQRLLSHINTFHRVHNQQQSLKCLVPTCVL
jgi:hypothetical protein